MPIAIIVALLSLIGVVVGAGLQHFFTRAAEHKKHLRILRTDAYIDYIRSIGEMEQAISLDPFDLHRREAFAKAISAKARVCACGSTNVVKALAMFEGYGLSGMTPEKERLFINFIVMMREDIGGGESLVDEESIKAILFGIAPSHNNTNQPTAS